MYKYTFKFVKNWTNKYIVLCDILHDNFVSYVVFYVYYVTLDVCIYLYGFIAQSKFKCIDISWN